MAQYNMSWEDDDRAPLRTLERNYPLVHENSGVLGENLLKNLARSYPTEETVTTKSNECDKEKSYYDADHDVEQCDDEEVVTPANSQQITPEEEYNADILDNMIYEKMW
jgi:hypothetical protein